MIFQDPFGSLNPVKTIRHHLERPLRIHRIVPRAQVEERVHELLRTVGLVPPEQIAAKYPYELSGGQRQRVAIARALAVEPKVVLADEPTSMLDVSIRIGILNLMLKLKEERELALLYVTHDLASARYVADEMLVMFAGQIVERGPTEEVLQNPLHPYTRLLLSSVPDPAEGLDLQRVERRPADHVVTAETARLPVRRPLPACNRALSPRAAGAPRGAPAPERPMSRHRPGAMARIGLMLYSVRDECARDFEGVLRSVAAMGYEGVELFDLHGHEAAAVRGWLDELGLVAVSRHAGLDAIETRLPELAEESRVLGWRRLALSWLDPATLETPGLAAHIGDLAAAAREQGLELGFHNHDAELRPSPPARPSSTSCRPSSGSSSISAGPGTRAWTSAPSSSASATGARSSTSRTSRRARAGSSVRSATGRSATTGSPRRRSRRASNGCWSSRTRPRGRRSTPRSDRSRR